MWRVFWRCMILGVKRVKWGNGGWSWPLKLKGKTKVRRRRRNVEAYPSQANSPMLVVSLLMSKQACPSLSYVTSVRTNYECPIHYCGIRPCRAVTNSKSFKLMYMLYSNIQLCTNTVTKKGQNHLTPVIIKQIKLALQAAASER